MKQVFRQNRSKLLLFFLITSLLAAGMIADAFLLQVITNVATRKIAFPLLPLVAVTSIFLLLQTGIYFFQQSFQGKLIKELANQYRNRLFSQFEKLSAQRVLSRHSGEYLSELTTQIETLENSYFYPLLWGSYLIFQCLFATLAALWLNPILTLLVLVLSLPNLLLPYFFQNKLAQKRRQVVKETGQLYRSLEDLLKGLEAWLSLRKEHFILGFFYQKTEELLAKNRQLIDTEEGVAALTKIFSDFLYYGSWLCGAFFILRGQMTLAQMIAFAQLISNISFPIHQFSDLLTTFIGGQEVKTHLAEVFSLGKDSPSAAGSEERLQAICLQQFKAIATSKQVPLDYCFQMNKKYLLLAQSGQGKTSLLRALLKLNPSYSGRIVMNGKELNEWQEKELFTRLGYLPQEIFIFNASLRENLRLFDSATSDEQLMTVLKQVNLPDWATVEGLDTLLGSGGKKLSGGESKRLGLARLLLKNYDFLLLDELSAGLDAGHLASLEEQLFHLDIGFIYVTHQVHPELIDQADAVVNL